MTFAAPAPAGDQLPAAEVLGHLLLIAPHEYRTGIITKFTKAGQPGEDAIVIDCAVLTQQDATGQVPVFRDALWFNIGLRLTLKKQMGQLVLARMGQGEGKQGQDPPFTLIDATQDAQAVAFAEAWLGQHPEFEADATRKAAAAAGAPAAPMKAPQPPPAGVPVPGVPANASAHMATAPAVPAVPTVPAVPVAAPVAAPPTAVAIDPAVLASLPADQQAAIRALMGQAG